MIYDVSGHALLSKKVLALKSESPEAFSKQVSVAEMLLGVYPPASTQVLVASRLSLAVVLQLNFQIEQGIDPLYVSASSSSHTRNSVQYRDRHIDPRAAQIVAQTQGLHGRYAGTMVSHRFGRNE